MKTITHLLLTLVISVSLTVIPAQQAQAAGMINTQSVVSTLSIEQQVIENFIRREDVKSELIKFGISDIQVSQRLLTLSESEVQELSVQIKQAQAGGILVAILIVILIVILIKKI